MSLRIWSTEQQSNRGKGNRPITHADNGSTELETGESPAVKSLSESEIFDVIRNSRRRAVISYLLGNGGEASVENLTEHVARQEYNIAAEEMSSDHTKRAYTGLYQCHLPRLEKYSVVEFDKDEMMVRLDTTASQVEPYLTRNLDKKHVRFEMTIAIGTAILVMFGVFGVGPFAGVSIFVWSILTVIALVGLGLFQLSK